MNYYPLKLKPCYKSYLWGGNRLKEHFNKADAPEICAESWELAEHKDGSTKTENGSTLCSLAGKDHDGFFGKNVSGDAVPIIVKLIDANHDLSIQVHPSDDTALKELGESGKTEMWYIVDCLPGSSVYLGFSERVDPECFAGKANDGSICSLLNRVTVSPGDVFCILPGTIHAIGGGIVIAEIRQCSNTTFRVYDYERIGTDGKPRTLHMERAAKVLDFSPSLPEECKANNSAYFDEFTLSEMFSCGYFSSYRIDVRTQIRLFNSGDSFRHILCVGGGGTITAHGKEYEIRTGDSYFIPAKTGLFTINGRCRVLLSQV